MNKMIGNISIIGLIICAIFLVFSIFTHKPTPAEKAAIEQQEAQKEVQRKAMEQQLRTITKGDFLEGFNGTIFIVKEAYHEGAISKIVSWGPLGYNQRFNNQDMSTIVKRIIRKTDPDYPAAAVKFINQ